MFKNIRKAFRKIGEKLFTPREAAPSPYDRIIDSFDQYNGCFRHTEIRRNGYVCITVFEPGDIQYSLTVFGGEVSCRRDGTESAITSLDPTEFPITPVAEPYVRPYLPPSAPAVKHQAKRPIDKNFT